MTAKELAQRLPRTFSGSFRWSDELIDRYILLHVDKLKAIERNGNAKRVVFRGFHQRMGASGRSDRLAFGFGNTSVRGRVDVATLEVRIVESYWLDGALRVAVFDGTLRADLGMLQATWQPEWTAPVCRMTLFARG